jgi:hypothetical protein
MKATKPTAVSLGLLAGFLAAATAMPVQAQNKKPAAKKPPAPAAAAAAKKPTGPVVLGTTQLPGDFGQLGTTYTIGKAEPINFTLRSAEYSIVPVTIGTNTWVPKADEKLLVLRYTVHNPLPREQSYDWWRIRFTAVDAKDTNHEFIQTVARDGTTEKLSVRLKPAQKIDVYAAILVPGEGVVPKLIVEREKGAPVVRYDLRGKATPLPAPAADAADASGATARKEVPARPGAFFTLGVFDARLDEVAYADGPLGRNEPGKGKRFLTALVTLKNRSNRNERYVWSDFRAELRDADGEKVPCVQTLLKASRDEATYGDLAPGEEVRVRFLFPLPADVAAKTLRLAEGKQVHGQAARVFAFELTGATSAASGGTR